MDQNQEIECEIEAANREMELLKGLPKNERTAGHMSEKRMEVMVAMLDAQLQMSLVQAERTERAMELAILSSKQEGSCQELTGAPSED